MIPLIQHPGKVVRFLRQNRRPFIITLIVPCICVLLWLVVSFSVFTPTTVSLTSAREGDALIASPIQSAGCGKSSPIAPGSSSNQTIFSGGITRSYLLHIPRGYHDTVGQPLVLNFHGHGSSALQQQYRTGFSILADTYDVIVAYPQGVVGPDHHTGWDTGPQRNPSTNDVLFVSDLLNHSVHLLRKGRFAQLPDLLHRPASRPLHLDLLAVRTGRTLRRPCLDQLFHYKALSPEELDPSAIAQLKIHLVLPLHAVHAEVIVDQALSQHIRLHILADELKRGTA